LKREEVKNAIEINQIKERIEFLTEELQRLEANPQAPENFELVLIKDKESDIYKRAENASIIGDTVGDPLKDTSGPSLNILIKLSSIISVVFGSLFLKTGYFK